MFLANLLAQRFTGGELLASSQIFDKPWHGGNGPTVGTKQPSCVLAFLKVQAYDFGVEFLDIYIPCATKPFIFVGFATKPWVFIQIMPKPWVFIANLGFEAKNRILLLICCYAVVYPHTPISLLRKRQEIVQLVVTDLVHKEFALFVKQKLG